MRWTEFNIILKGSRKINVNRIERLGSKLPLESLPTPLGVYIFFFLARAPATVFTFLLLYKRVTGSKIFSLRLPNLVFY